MKVSFNQTYSINNCKSFYNSKPIINQEPTQNSDSLPEDGLTLAHFPNVSFGKARIKRINPDAQLLLRYSKHLKCAYSGLPMIAPWEAQSMYNKLLKKPNAQAAINFLQPYREIMHDVEKSALDLFASADNKNSRTFKDILNENKGEALERLRTKQVAVLTSADKIIEEMEPETASQVAALRDRAISQTHGNDFVRKNILKYLEEIKTLNYDDAERIQDIYALWYKLPNSSSDLDAFIVQYSKESHDVIAKRLITPSVATIEHVKPENEGGKDKLGNYLLVSAEFNNNRQSLPLHKYIALNPEMKISENLQGYLNSIAVLMSDSKQEISNHGYYPERLKDTVAKETRQQVNLKFSETDVPLKQKHKQKFPLRLGKFYRLPSKTF